GGMTSGADAPVQVTPAAAAALRHVLAGAPGMRVRLSAIGGGALGLQYSLWVAPPADGDAQFQVDGIGMCADPASLEAVVGSPSTGSRREAACFSSGGSARREAAAALLSDCDGGRVDRAIGAARGEARDLPRQ